MAQIAMVAGFLFRGDDVLLVKKTKPSWQAGLFNGIGGKIKDGEKPIDAMYREFSEEVGWHINEPNWGTTWRGFAQESQSDYLVYFYRAFLDVKLSRPVPPVANDAGEILGWVNWRILQSQHVLIGNLNWLLPLAMDWRNIYVNAATSDNISRQPAWR